MTDLQRKGESLGVPGMRCDGMDVLDTYEVVREAVRRVREERTPLLVEAVTYRFRGHSMADPEEYRTKEEVARWRERDPLPAFAQRLIAEGVIDAGESERIDAEAIGRVDAAVAFAEASPFPAAESLYDDVYVLDAEVRGLYANDPGEDRAAAHAASAGSGADTAARSDAGEREHAGEDAIPQQLTDALAVGEDSHESTGQAR